MAATEPSLWSNSLLYEQSQGFQQDHEVPCAGRMEQECLVLVYSLVFLMNTNFWLCRQILHRVQYLDLDRGYAKCCYVHTVEGEGLQKAAQRKDHCNGGTFFLVSS